MEYDMVETLCPHWEYWFHFQKEIADVALNKVFQENSFFPQ
jgi:hypothetical protein